jgi:hypothetical protein
MAKPLTTSKLINAVKQRAMLPTNSKTFSISDFIEILNEEMDTGIVPEVLKQHEEYYTVFEDIVAEEGKTRFRIPYRAIGSKLRDVMFVSDTGHIYELSRISLEELSEYQNTSDYGIDDVFYVENNEIVFPRRQRSGGVVRMYFHLRPNSLVLESETARITSIDFNTGVVTVSSIPTAMQSLTLVDFVAHRSPNRIEGYDVPVSSVRVSSNEITITPSLLPEELMVGDYICLPQESPIPQIPVEMHPMLAQKAAIFCLESLNDSEGLANAQRKMERMESDVDVLINNRIEGAPKKVVARSGTIRDSAYKTSRKRKY